MTLPASPYILASGAQCVHIGGTFLASSHRDETPSPARIMRTMSSSLSLIPPTALLVLVAAGCGDSEPPATVSVDPHTAIATEASAPQGASAGGPSATAPSATAPDVPDDPDEGADPAGERPTVAPTVGAALAPPAVPPTGLVRVVVIAEHTLLRSEERTVDGIVRALHLGDVRVERVDAAERAAPLTTWLTTGTRTDRQSALGTALPEGHALHADADAVVLLRVLPPDGRRSQGVGGFAVLAGAPLREVVFGDGPLFAEAAAALVTLLTEAP